MRNLNRAAVAAAATVASAAGLGATAASAASAATTATAAPAAADGGTGHAVFVQTDNPAGNQVVAYDRGTDGRLTEVATYDTGGLGGVLAGSVVDHLASQGSLAYDPVHRLLIAVNAGSSTIAVFAVRGDQLQLRQVLPSGGTFPVSVTTHRDLVYVLNAENGGAIAGFRIRHGHLHAIDGSVRALGLDPAASPQFTHTPGQVAFSPDGRQLLITTKANGNDVDVFAVDADGRPSSTAVINAEPGTVPFAGVFDSAGQFVVTEAGPNAVVTFALHPDGTLSQLSNLATGQAATCWVAAAGGFFYASNAGSGSVTGVAADPAGNLTGLGNTATDGGTVDAAATADGQFLYVQTGHSGIVDEYQVGAGGSLTQLGSLTAPGAAGGEGIAVE